MQTDVYAEEIRREDGSYAFVVKSKDGNVPIAISVYSYSSLDECEQAIAGLALEHGNQEK